MRPITLLARLAKNAARPFGSSHRLARPTAPRLGLEALEDRWMPTVSTYLTAYQGVLVVQGDAANDQVEIEHGTDNYGRGYTSIREGYGSEALPKVYYDYTFGSLSLRLGAGSDTAFVRGTPANKTLFVVGGGNVDRLFLGDRAGRLDGIAGPVNISDTVGSTYLSLNGTGHANGLSVNFDSFTSGGAEYGLINGATRASIIYETRGTPSVGVYSGSGNDSFDVRRMAGDVALIAGAGDDIVYASSTDPNGRGTSRLVYFDGMAGHDTFLQEDSGATDGRQYSLYDSGFQVGSRFRANMLRPEELILSLGAGNDTVEIGAVSSLSSMSLFGGGGANRLVSSDNGATFTVTDPDTGTVADPIGGGTAGFWNFGTLVGSIGPDTFRIWPDVYLTIDGARYTSPRLSGGIDGGGGDGTNTLDYSAFPGNVTVNLALGNAERVQGKIAHIQDVIGGHGTNLLVGDAGHNVLAAPAGHRGRNILIGGGGEDILFGGAGDDLLIGGTVDLNADELARVRDVWASSKDFATRVNALTTGAGVGRPLNNRTVHNDGAEDQLTGGGGRDWFFASLQDSVWDFVAKDDRLTRI